MGLRGKAHRLLLTAMLSASGLLALPAGAWATGVAPAPAYSLSSGTSSMIPGTSLVSGSKCDDCVVTTSLPFDFTYMGKTYSAGATVHIGSNGTFSFDTAFTNLDYSSTCSLPEAGHGAALFPLWEDLDASKDPAEGIFTAVSGSAPFRTFVIEWRTQLHTGGSADDVHFEVQLSESNDEIRYVYQTVNGQGAGAAVAIQQASVSGAATDIFECQTGGITDSKAVYLNPSHPTVKGTPEQGEELQATANGFSGSPAPVITYQWQRCDGHGTASTCVDIANATGDQFLLTHADISHTLRVRTTATNASGSASTFSGTTDAIRSEPPPSPVYSMTKATGATYVAGTTNTGSGGDDVQSAISFPFPIVAFGQSYTSGYIGSNGSLGLGNNSTVDSNDNGCLPDGGLTGNVIAAYQMDQRTDTPGAGVFSRVIGSAPHRTFVLDWRTSYFGDATKKARYEILLREDSPIISVVFGSSADSGASAVSGIQHDPLGPVAQFSCGAATDTPGTVVTYTPSQPLLSSGHTQGTPVTVKSAQFSGSPTLKAQWERCNSQGLACAVIPGATGGTYVPAVQDIGHTLRVRQTAINQFGSGATVSKPSGVVAAKEAPKLASLRLTPSSLRAAASGGSIATPTASTGTTVSFTLSFPGTVRFTVARVKSGKRTTLKRSFSSSGKAGANSLHFTGRLGGRALTPGRYILFAQPMASGHRGTRSSAAFKILP
jgi:hypothetical protein